MPDRLTDRRTLVTGSTAGIGAHVAAALAAEGAHVIVSGRGADRGATVVDSIRAAGGTADFAQADLAGGTAASDYLIARATDLAGGSIQLLVNNAAQLISAQSMLDPTEEQIDQALRQFTADHPEGRPGTGDQVAAAVVSLASDDAAHIHGSTLSVDGGLAAVISAH